jgi:chemotaxis protein MotB
MPLDKLARVVGMASSDLLLPEEPRAAQNRRITITVLTKEAERRVLGNERSAARGDSAKAATGAIARSTSAQQPRHPAVSGCQGRVCNKP